MSETLKRGNSVIAKNSSLDRTRVMLSQNPEVSWFSGAQARLAGRRQWLVAHVVVVVVVAELVLQIKQYYQWNISIVCGHFTNFVPLTPKKSLKFHLEYQIKARIG